MKKKIIIIIAIILLVLFCSIFYILKLKNREQNKLTQNMEVVPTMNDNISENSSWCGTFQLVWNDMINEVIKKEIKIEPAMKMVDNLNKKDFNTSMISEDYYYKKYGPKTLALKKEIEKSIKDKFNQSSDILDNFNWDDTALNNDTQERYFFYAMLYREFEYNKKFSVLKTAKFNNYDNIKYFGIDKKSTDEVRNQIEVLFYNSKDSFAVKLHTKNNDEVILYKNPKGNTFNEIYNNIKKESINYQGNKNFTEQDKFKAPMIDFNVKREYKELSNKPFTSIDNKEYVIDTAVQTVSFSLDEKGGKIKSEAGLDIETTSMPVEEKPRYFNVDNTFAIFLKEAQKDNPYFAAKISDITKFQKGV